MADPRPNTPDNPYVAVCRMCRRNYRVRRGRGAKNQLRGFRLRAKFETRYLCPPCKSTVRPAITLLLLLLVACGGGGDELRLSPHAGNWQCVLVTEADWGYGVREYVACIEDAQDRRMFFWMDVWLEAPDAVRATTRWIDEHSLPADAFLFDGSPFFDHPLWSD